MRPAALALVALAACGGTLNVKADWNTTVDFTTYKTFDFQHDSLAAPALTQQRVHDDIAATLMSKGLTRDAADPQLHVIYRINVSSETQVTQVQSGGYANGPAWNGWNGYGGMSAGTQKQVPLGALTVALIDTKENKLVWRGEADAELDQGQSGTELIQQAVQRMFKQFPTKPGVMPADEDF